MPQNITNCVITVMKISNASDHFAAADALLREVAGNYSIVESPALLVA